MPASPGPSGQALAALAFAAALQGAVASGADTTDPTLDARQHDLSEIERKVQVLSAELAGESEERRALIAELQERERNVAALALANRELQRLVDEQTKTGEALRKREGEEQKNLGREADRLALLLRTAYAMGRADTLRMLLNQEDPARASRVMSYFAYFNRERVARIRAVERAAERLSLLAQNAEREAARLTELATRQEDTRRRLETARDERSVVLANLERSIQGREENIAGLRRDAENLRLLVQHLRQRAEIQAELDVRRDPFSSRRGSLPWPLAEHRVLAAFGSSKGGSDLSWDGVLLAARDGEEVHAIYDGRVVYADWLKGFGLLLAIDHGDGYMSLYGQNEALLKEVGEWVSAGDAVALGGDSGGQASPVLYFAIRHNGEPVDPAHWCG